MTGEDGQLRVGLDIGGTKILGVLLDQHRRVVRRARASTPQPVPAGGSGTADDTASGNLAGEIADAVVEVVERLQAPELCALGIGAPGMVDHQGTVRLSPNLPALSGVDLQGVLGARFPLRPVVAGNDATCAARAEHLLGAGRGTRHMLMVTLGTGIGGGMIIDGRLATGAGGFAGEIGHMVVDPNGPPCPCGGRGCWERYASGDGLGRLAREAAAAGLLPRVVALAGGDHESVRGEHVAGAAQVGDAGARRVLEDVGWWLALGLANLTAALDPECIVVGGGLIGAGEMLLEPARRAFVSLVHGGGCRPPVTITAAVLGEEAGAVGAALLDAAGEEGRVRSADPAERGTDGGTGQSA